jgi:hypothetical protein
MSFTKEALKNGKCPKCSNMFVMRTRNYNCDYCGLNKTDLHEMCVQCDYDLCSACKIKIKNLKTNADVIPTMISPQLLDTTDGKELDDYINTALMNIQIGGRGQLQTQSRFKAEDTLNNSRIDAIEIQTVYSRIYEEYESNKTRLKGIKFGLGCVAYHYGLRKHNPRVFMAEFDNNYKELGWSRLGQDYVKMVENNFRKPGGGTKLYESIQRFLTSFKRQATQGRPWLIYLFTDGEDSNKNYMFNEALRLIKEINSDEKKVVTLFYLNNSFPNQRELESVGCGVVSLPYCPKMGGLIMKQLETYCQIEPEIGLLIDVSGSMGTIDERSI